MGPPRFAPNWFRLNGGGWLEVNVKKFLASNASLRRNWNSSPWKSLVPERVATFTTAPELWPYSALSVELSILTSRRELIDGRKRMELYTKSFSVIPLI